MKSISLFKHVNNSLNPYRWLTSVVVAVLISGLFAGLTLRSRLNTDKQMVEALSPYFSALVESSDRPEILRVIQSIASVQNSKVVVVQDGNVLASSGELSELDTPFEVPVTNFHFLDVNFSTSQIVTEKEIKRQGHPVLDAQIYILSPFLPSVQSTFFIFIVTFIVCILISMFSAKQTRKAIKKALRPLDQLHQEIKGLIFDEEIKSVPIQIKELEEIRHTVNATKIDLENVRDRLAEERAKKLSAESYKSLIHDLHNPVAALRQMAKISNDETASKETRAEAAQIIPNIADQILSQVTSAKKNLEEESIALRELNLLTCVQESILQIKSISSTKTIVSVLSKDELTLAHDPGLLKRALVNLIENGIEFAASTVRVTVDKNSDGAFIRVCDDGPGMDESKIPVYFQGRGQSGKANRQAFGLSSTNHIVRSHGGKLIYRKSDLGGSSFEIRLGGV